MGFPLIPFAAGLAVGALATYGSRDATVQKQVKVGAERTVAGVEWLYDAVVGGVSSLLGLGAAEQAPAKAKRSTAKATVAEGAATPVKRTRAKKAATTKVVKRTTARAAKSAPKEEATA